MFGATQLFRLALDCATNKGFLPGLYDNISCGSDGQFNISSVQDFLTVIANIVRILIAVSGGIAVIVIIVAAIYYVTSAGDPGRIKRAKDILLNMTIGLFLIMGAYALVTWIGKGF